MSNVLIGGSSGGAMSDECTATLADVAKGKTAVTKDSDDEIGVGTLELTGNAGTEDVIKGVTFYNNDLYTKRTGTLELTGNATAGYVYSGKTFYSTNPKQKLTGTMTVNSLLSFSVAASSGRRLVATWKNPTAATGKPYSGVYIKYSTSGYPGKGGTQIYKGAGNNTSSGGTSSVNLDMPNLNTTYYFSIYPYVTCSVGEMTGNVLNATRATSGQSTITITSTRTYSIPAGYSIMDIFCVGGGSGGTGGNKGTGSRQLSGSGGGSGYTSTKTGISISTGQSLTCTIGSGNGSGGTGGTTSVVRSGSTLCSASGGSWQTGGSGGGGNTGELRSENDGFPGTGGSDGSKGEDGAWTEGGKGQGTTTRAFGESGGTLYAGGGGGGGAYSVSGASGGSGGGGRGGERVAIGNSGTANTGGGGGGSGALYYGGSTGGSGIILLRFK